MHRKGLARRDVDHRRGIAGLEKGRGKQPEGLHLLNMAIVEKVKLLWLKAPLTKKNKKNDSKLFT